MSNLPLPCDPFLTALVAALGKCNPKEYSFLCNEIDPDFKEQLQGELIARYKFERDPDCYSIPCIDAIILGVSTGAYFRKHLTEKAYLQMVFDLRHKFVSDSHKSLLYHPIHSGTGRLIYV